MKKLKRTICFLLIAVMATGVMACSKKDEKQEIFDLFTKMYEIFNDKKFDEYVKYFKIEGNDQKTMLTNLQGMEQYFEQTYTLVEVNIEDERTDAGEIKATVKSSVESKNLQTEQKTQFIETMKYTIKKDGGKWIITSSTAGKNEMLEYDPGNSQLTEAETTIETTIETTKEVN